jgi:predicted GNAT family N-acyltransferase
MQINWEIKHFSALTALEYHNMLQLRVAVFVIEQDCPYPEVDGLDPQCYHLLATDMTSNEVIGTARIIPAKLIFDEVSSRDNCSVSLTIGHLDLQIGVVAITGVAQCLDGAFLALAKIAIGDCCRRKNNVSTLDCGQARIRRPSRDRNRGKN